MRNFGKKVIGGERERKRERKNVCVCVRTHMHTFFLSLFLSLPPPITFFPRFFLSEIYRDSIQQVHARNRIAE